jgi:hypothetical protein
LEYLEKEDVPYVFDRETWKLYRMHTSDPETWTEIEDGDRASHIRYNLESGSMGGEIVAVIAMFYGIIVSMYFFDNRRHHKPHIHVRYQGNEVVIGLPEGEVLEGAIPAGKLKLVAAWIELHREELMADWELASQGETVFTIDPLR